MTLGQPTTAGLINDSLADGEWHRMHPMTPLLKGGIPLILLFGVIFGVLRDRLIGWFIAIFFGRQAAANWEGSVDGDALTWVLESNRIWLAILAVLAVMAVVVIIFWLQWRVHQFRITGDHVEVRRGIVFRQRRRAPLDRVQVVNLTRPFFARLVGLAKLEVVGAGTDGNVELEYLSTAKAERVRDDILLLASGARSSKQPRSAAAVAGVLPPSFVAPAPGSAPTAHTRRGQLESSVSGGVQGLFEGVDLADVAPESVLKIPTGRLLGSIFLSVASWFVVVLAILLVAIMWAVDFIRDQEESDPLLTLIIGLGVSVPLVIAFVGVLWSRISKSLRYSITPTPDGVRITYGLTTTVTETLPPGRIFAIEIYQSLIWRPFGWWAIRINRMSGKSASAQQSNATQQFNIVLPVGVRADVLRVLGMFMPGSTHEEIDALWVSGLGMAMPSDGYHTMARRTRWRRPLSWRRNGFAYGRLGLLIRKGKIWRSLAIFPFARLQGLTLAQGPLSRAQGVSSVRLQTITGQVTGSLVGIEREDALQLLGAVGELAADATERDLTHRWAEAR